MNNRTILIAAVALGLVAALINFSYLASASGDSIRLLKVKDPKGLKSGTLVTSDMLEEVTLRGDVGQLTHLAVRPEDLPAFKETPLVESLKPGDLLLLSSFRVQGDTGVAGEILPGERALSVSVADEQKAVGYFVHPGDVVDVWGTIGGNAYLLKDHARVAAVGDVYQMGTQSAAEQKFRSVTLVVSAKDVEGMVHNIALAGGAVTLTLLGADDAKAPSGPALQPVTITKDSLNASGLGRGGKPPTTPLSQLPPEAQPKTPTQTSPQLPAPAPTAPARP